jgi:hypothetical protein
MWEIDMSLLQVSKSNDDVATFIKNGEVFEQQLNRWKLYQSFKLVELTNHVNLSALAKWHAGDRKR